MLDLLSRVELDLPDARVTLHGGFLAPDAAQAALVQLTAETPWRQDTITLWGKPFRQPRLTAWYGDAQAAYTYSGLKLDPLPWTALLSTFKARVEAAAAARFNSVLLNFYRDQHDSMGFHSDDEAELGPAPTIASLSLGDTRVFILRHRWRRELKPVRVPLDSGSLLLMAGETQHAWKHGINKQRTACGPRINLTFRLIRR